MKKRKVIKGTNTRIKNPIAIGVLLYLFLKDTNSPEWVFGLFGGFIAILLIAHITDVFRTEEVDIFKDKE